MSSGVDRPDAGGAGTAGERPAPGAASAGCLRVRSCFAAEVHAANVCDMPLRLDGTTISQDEAIDLWAKAARPYLIEVAEAHSTTTYKALANHVREATGVTTKQLIVNWIGRVLGRVGEQAESRGEPHLTSLCVDVKGSVGGGYPWAPADATVEERDSFAQQHRMECYARYGSGSEAARASAKAALIPPTEDDLQGADEGGLSLRQHLARDRHPGLRKRKIGSLHRNGEPIACEVCGFDFEKVYGERGRDYCEIHHRVPLHESGPTKTRLEDLAVLCANCHRMIHRGVPWLTVEALIQVIKHPH